MDTYLQQNRKAWNLKTEVHLHAEFYGNEAFLRGKSSLNPLELEWLGDIRGQSLLHLQCHFGQDSISLSRLGAQVTGVDLSDRAVEVAREMASQLGTDTRFVCSDVYSLPLVLEEQFDRVFTSYGVIGWLPDLEQWAAVVARFLKPGGCFTIVEFHPVVWMFDEDFQRVAYRYFNSGEIVETQSGTYADSGSDIQYTTVTWNHSLSEVIGALIRAGLRISRFEEYDASPYNCFRHTVQTEEGMFRIRHLEDKIPMLFALEAFKP